MILPEDIITTKNIGSFGFSALYDTCNDSIIAEGVILVYALGSVNYLFRLKKPIDVLEEDSAFAQKRSILSLQLLKSVTSFGRIDLQLCRFPTEEELNVYLKHYGKPY